MSGSQPTRTTPGAEDCLAMAEPGAGPRIDGAGRATSGWISSTPPPVAEETAPVTSAIKVVNTQGAEITGIAARPRKRQASPEAANDQLNLGRRDRPGGTSRVCC